MDRYTSFVLKRNSSVANTQTVVGIQAKDNPIELLNFSEDFEDGFQSDSTHGGDTDRDPALFLRRDPFRLKNEISNGLNVFRRLKIQGKLETVWDRDAGTRAKFWAVPSTSTSELTVKQIKDQIHKLRCRLADVEGRRKCEEPEVKRPVSREMEILQILTSLFFLCSDPRAEDSKCKMRALRRAVAYSRRLSKKMFRKRNRVSKKRILKAFEKEVRLSLLLLKQYRKSNGRDEAQKLVEKVSVVLEAAPKIADAKDLHNPDPELLDMLNGKLSFANALFLYNQAKLEIKANEPVKAIETLLTVYKILVQVLGRSLDLEESAESLQEESDSFGTDMLEGFTKSQSMLDLSSVRQTNFSQGVSESIVSRDMSRVSSLAPIMTTTGTVSTSRTEDGDIDAAWSTKSLAATNVVFVCMAKVFYHIANQFDKITVNRDRKELARDLNEAARKMFEVIRHKKYEKLSDELGDKIIQELAEDSIGQENVDELQSSTSGFSSDWPSSDESGEGEGQTRRSNFLSTYLRNIIDNEKKTHIDGFPAHLRIVDYCQGQNGTEETGLKILMKKPVNPTTFASFHGDRRILMNAREFDEWLSELVSSGEDVWRKTKEEQSLPKHPKKVLGKLLQEAKTTDSPEQMLDTASRLAAMMVHNPDERSKIFNTFIRWLEDIKETNKTRLEDLEFRSRLFIIGVEVVRRMSTNESVEAFAGLGLFDNPAESLYLALVRIEIESLELLSNSKDDDDDDRGFKVFKSIVFKLACFMEVFGGSLVKVVNSNNKAKDGMNYFEHRITPSREIQHIQKRESIQNKIESIIARREGNAPSERPSRQDADDSTSDTESIDSMSQSSSSTSTSSDSDTSTSSDSDTSSTSTDSDDETSYGTGPQSSSTEMEDMSETFRFTYPNKIREMYRDLKKSLLDTSGETLPFYLKPFEDVDNFFMGYALTLLQVHLMNVPYITMDTRPTSTQRVYVMMNSDLMEYLAVSPGLKTRISILRHLFDVFRSAHVTMSLEYGGHYFTRLVLTQIISRMGFVLGKYEENLGLESLAEKYFFEAIWHIDELQRMDQEMFYHPFSDRLQETLLLHYADSMLYTGKYDYAIIVIEQYILLYRLRGEKLRVSFLKKVALECRYNQDWVRSIKYLAAVIPYVPKTEVIFITKMLTETLLSLGEFHVVEYLIRAVQDVVPFRSLSHYFVLEEIFLRTLSKNLSSLEHEEYLKTISEREDVRSKKPEYLNIIAKEYIRNGKYDLALSNLRQFVQKFKMLQLSLHLISRHTRSTSKKMRETEVKLKKLSKPVFQFILNVIELFIATDDPTNAVYWIDISLKGTKSENNLAFMAKLYNLRARALLKVLLEFQNEYPVTFEKKKLDPLTRFIQEKLRPKLSGRQRDFRVDYSIRFNSMKDMMTEIVYSYRLSRIYYNAVGDIHKEMKSTMQLLEALLRIYFDYYVLTLDVSQLSRSAFLGYIKEFPRPYVSSFESIIVSEKTNPTNYQVRRAPKNGDSLQDDSKNDMEVISLKSIDSLLEEPMEYFVQHADPLYTIRCFLIKSQITFLQGHPGKAAGYFKEARNMLYSLFFIDYRPVFSTETPHWFLVKIFYTLEAMLRFLLGVEKSYQSIKNKVVSLNDNLILIDSYIYMEHLVSVTRSSHISGRGSEDGPTFGKDFVCNGRVVNKWTSELFSNYMSNEFDSGPMPDIQKENPSHMTFSDDPECNQSRAKTVKTVNDSYMFLTRKKVVYNIWVSLHHIWKTRQSMEDLKEINSEYLLQIEEMISGLRKAQYPDAYRGDSVAASKIQKGKSVYNFGGESDDCIDRFWRESVFSHVSYNNLKSRGCQHVMYVLKLGYIIYTYIPERQTLDYGIINWSRFRGMLSSKQLVTSESRSFATDTIGHGSIFRARTIRNQPGRSKKERMNQNLFGSLREYRATTTDRHVSDTDTLITAKNIINLEDYFAVIEELVSNESEKSKDFGTSSGQLLAYLIGPDAMEYIRDSLPPEGKKRAQGRLFVINSKYLSTIPFESAVPWSRRIYREFSATHLLKMKQSEAIRNVTFPILFANSVDSLDARQREMECREKDFKIQCLLEMFENEKHIKAENVLDQIKKGRRFGYFTKGNLFKSTYYEQPEGQYSEGNYSYCSGVLTNKKRDKICYIPVTRTAPGKCEPEDPGELREALKSAEPLPIIVNVIVEYEDIPVHRYGVRPKDRRKVRSYSKDSTQNPRRQALSEMSRINFGEDGFVEYIARITRSSHTGIVKAEGIKKRSLRAYTSNGSQGAVPLLLVENTQLINTSSALFDIVDNGFRVFIIAYPVGGFDILLKKLEGVYRQPGAGERNKGIARRFLRLRKEFRKAFGKDLIFINFPF